MLTTQALNHTTNVVKPCGYMYGRDLIESMNPHLLLMTMLLEAEVQILGRHMTQRFHYPALKNQHLNISTFREMSKN